MLKLRYLALPPAFLLALALAGWRPEPPEPLRKRVRTLAVSPLEPAPTSPSNWAVEAIATLIMRPFSACSEASPLDDNPNPGITFYGEASLETVRQWYRLAQALPKAQDPDVQRILWKLETMTLNLSFENAKMIDILEYIRDFSGLNIILDAPAAGSDIPDQKISLNLKEWPMKEALRLVISFGGLDYVVTDDLVVLLTDPKKARGFSQQHSPDRVITFDDGK
jgi:hypothetical protein